MAGVKSGERAEGLNESFRCNDFLALPGLDRSGKVVDHLAPFFVFHRQTAQRAALRRNIAVHQRWEEPGFFFAVMATVRECAKKLDYAVQQGRIDVAAGFKPVGQNHHPSDNFLDDTMFGFERLDRDLDNSFDLLYDGGRIRLAGTPPRRQSHPVDLFSIREVDRQSRLIKGCVGPFESDWAWINPLVSLFLVSALRASPQLENRGHYRGRHCERPHAAPRHNEQTRRKPSRTRVPRRRHCCHTFSVPQLP